MSYDNHSDFSVSEDEDDICPLCCEDMDITDKNFKPCPCGYQICQFCYNNIRTNPELNGKCPACRRLYDDNIEYRNLTLEEWKLQKSRTEKKKREKKMLEREKREAELAKRHHLAGMRVIQKNLVYVVGLNPPCSQEDLIPTLRSEKYFGQYGKINKIVINKRNPNSSANSFHNLGSNSPGYGVYVTFARKDDAARCISAIDGSISDGKLLRAAHGTTKYCSSYLRGQTCPNPNCMFLHEPGEEADSYSRQDLSSRSSNSKQDGKYRSDNYALGNTLDDTGYSPQGSPQSSIAQLSSANLNSFQSIENDGPALPASVSWANAKSSNDQPLAGAAGSSLSAFPTLHDVLQQSKQAALPELHQLNNQQQQQQHHLQQLLQKSQIQQDNSSQQRKKEKKDKDSQNPVVLDDAAITFKNVCDSLKSFNDQVSYSINPRFKSADYQIKQASIRLFHPGNLETNNETYGFNSDSTSKNRLVELTDALLFAPQTKNFNYRAYVAALQANQLAHTQTAQLARAATMSTPNEFANLNLTPSQLNASLSGTTTNDAQLSSTQAFLQQRLLQQQQQQHQIRQMQQMQMQQQQQGSNSGTPIQAPPGLYPVNNEAKSNSQEILTQLMGKKVQYNV